MGAAALEWAAEYLGSLRDLPITPRAGSAELRRSLAEPLPAEGRDFERVDVTEAAGRTRLVDIARSRA